MPKPNYEIENYCADCDVTYSKNILICPKCKQMVRRYSRFSGRGKFKIKCAECGHFYGDCACLCCRADELLANEIDKKDMDSCSGEFCKTQE